MQLNSHLFKAIIPTREGAQLAIHGARRRRRDAEETLGILNTIVMAKDGNVFGARVPEMN